MDPRVALNLKPWRDPPVSAEERERDAALLATGGENADRLCADFLDASFYRAMCAVFGTDVHEMIDSIQLLNFVDVDSVLHAMYAHGFLTDAARVFFFSRENTRDGAGLGERWESLIDVRAWEEEAGFDEFVRGGSSRGSVRVLPRTSQTGRGKGPIVVTPPRAGENTKAELIPFAEMDRNSFGYTRMHRMLVMIREELEMSLGSVFGLEEFMRTRSRGECFVSRDDAVIRAITARLVESGTCVDAGGGVMAVTSTSDSARPRDDWPETAEDDWVGLFDRWSEREEDARPQDFADVLVLVNLAHALPRAYREVFGLQTPPHGVMGRLLGEGSFGEVYVSVRFPDTVVKRQVMGAANNELAAEYVFRAAGLATECLMRVREVYVAQHALVKKSISGKSADKDVEYGANTLIVYATGERMDGDLVGCFAEWRHAARISAILAAASRTQDSSAAASPVVAVPTVGQKRTGGKALAQARAAKKAQTRPTHVPSPSQILVMAERLVRGMHEMHECGFAHTDLFARNVLVRGLDDPDPGVWQLRVADLGLAHAYAAETIDGDIMSVCDMIWTMLDLVPVPGLATLLVSREAVHLAVFNHNFRTRAWLKTPGFHEYVRAMVERSAGAAAHSSATPELAREAAMGWSRHFLARVPFVPGYISTQGSDGTHASAVLAHLHTALAGLALAYAPHKHADSPASSRARLDYTPAVDAMAWRATPPAPPLVPREDREKAARKARGVALPPAKMAALFGRTSPTERVDQDHEFNPLLGGMDLGLGPGFDFLAGGSEFRLRGDSDRFRPIGVVAGGEVVGEAPPPKPAQAMV